MSIVIIGHHLLQYRKSLALGFPPITAPCTGPYIHSITPLIAANSSASGTEIKPDKFYLSSLYYDL